MKKISQVLIDSQHTRTQVRGSLFHHAKRIEDIDSYCAMGALMCESELLENAENRDDGEDRICYPSDNRVIEHFAGEGKSHFDEIEVCVLCPDSDDSFYKNNPYQAVAVGSYIIHLNDQHKQTFEQIGKIMEKLGL